MLRKVVTLFASFPVLAGCSASEETTHGASGQGSSSTSSGSAASASASSSSGGEPGDARVFASFREETDPGEAPALVTFHNDTASPHTLWIADSTFYNISASAVDGPQIATTADLTLEMTVGLHLTDKTCLKKKFVGFEGPVALQPQHSYVVRAFIAEDGYHADTQEGAPASPFTAIRALVDDPFPLQEPGAFSTVVLMPADASSATAAVSFEAWSSDYATSYTQLPGDFQVAAIQFLDRGGGKRVGLVDQALSGAYTLVLAGEPAEGAAFSVELDLEPE